MIIEIKQKVKTTEDEMNKNTKKLQLSLLNIVFCLQITHKRHPITCPLGWGMECLSVMSSKSHLHSTLVIARSYVS